MPACPKCRKALRRNKRLQRRCIDSVHGWIEYHRDRYECPKCKKGYYPDDYELRLSSETRMSKKKEYQVVKLCTMLSYREAAEVYKELTGQRVEKTTSHRIIQKIGEVAILNQGREDKGEKGVRHHVGADGTMINIVGEGWKEVKVGVSYCVDDEGNAQEVDYVATIESREEIGESLYKISGSPEVEDTEEMAFLSDGASWLDTLRETHFPKATAILDFHHAAEYIWRVANSFYEMGTKKAGKWGQEKIELLKNGQHKKIRRILFKMKAKNKEERKELQSARSYFTNQGHKMNYPEYQALGYHIGSGVLEAACKHVVKDRFVKTGMRWSRNGAKYLLYFRTVYLNNELKNLIMAA